MVMMSTTRACAVTVVVLLAAAVSAAAGLPALPGGSQTASRRSATKQRCLYRQDTFAGLDASTAFGLTFLVQLKHTVFESERLRSSTLELTRRAQLLAIV